MACCGSIPPGTTPTTGSAAAALVAAVAGAPSSSLANYGGGHLIVTHFLGRDVHDQVLCTCPASGISSPGAGGCMATVTSP
jgi:hypothetical protein